MWSATSQLDKAVKEEPLAAGNSGYSQIFSDLMTVCMKTPEVRLWMWMGWRGSKALRYRLRVERPSCSSMNFQSLSESLSTWTSLAKPFGSQTSLFSNTAKQCPMACLLSPDACTTTYCFSLWQFVEKRCAIYYSSDYYFLTIIFFWLFLSTRNIHPQHPSIVEVRHPCKLPAFSPEKVNN